MFSLIPSDANDPQGLMRRKEPNKQTKFSFEVEEEVIVIRVSYRLTPLISMELPIKFGAVKAECPLYIERSHDVMFENKVCVFL